MPKKTLAISKLEVDYLGEEAGIHPNGGTIETSFEASRRGGGRLRARYVLKEKDKYVFSETVRVPDNPLEAMLDEEDIFPNPHKKELRLQKVAGGERLLKLEIDLIVEQMENGQVVGDGGPPKVFGVAIPKRVEQLLREGGHTHKEFAQDIGVEAHQVGSLKRRESASSEVVDQLPRSIEAHQEAQQKPEKKRTFKIKKRS